MTTTRIGKRLDFWGRDIKKRSIQWALAEMNRQIEDSQPTDRVVRIVDGTGTTRAVINQGDKK